MKKRNLHKMEDVFPDEFYTELKRCPIAYLTCGGVENHGPHNALGTDGLISYDIAVRAAEISGGLVYPPVFLGVPCWHCMPWEELRSTPNEIYRPSIWHSRELILQFYEETFWNLERLGFRVCIVIPGHAPNANLLKEYFKDKGDSYGKMKLQNVIIWAKDFISDFDPEELDHAGVWESSLLAALHPELSDPERVNMDLKTFPPEVVMNWRPEHLSPEKITKERVTLYLEHTILKIAEEAVKLLKQQ